MRTLRSLRIKDGVFYDESGKKVEVIPIGHPFVISYTSTGRTTKEDESIIIHRVTTGQWRLDKQCNAYIYGEKMYNSWNITGFPDYTMVAVQGYRIVKHHRRIAKEK